MVRKESLDSLPDLLDSGFGRPPPRHGLNLLYWFVTQLHFGYNNQITVLCSPSKGDYGFRLFRNKECLLPVTNMPYYEVGNLHNYGARDLPVYVRREDTGNRDDSNTDRIITCLNNISLESVYVTRHKGPWTFDPNQTFHISPQLLSTISDMEREDFLRQVTPYHITIPESTSETSPQLLRTISPMEREDSLRQATSHHITIPDSTTMEAYQPSENCAVKCCKMLCCLLLFILFIVLFILIGTVSVILLFFIFKYII